MNLIKGLFSKVFGTKRHNETSADKKDDSLLKEATRHAVLNAFQNENETTENTPVIHPQILKILDEYNEFFFRAFHIPKTHYKLKFDKKNIIIQINDKDFETILSKSDKLSVSYEHIFLRIVQKEFKNFDHRLFLHAGNSAKRHHAYVMNIAEKLALKVKQTGHKVTITAKSSYERSVIHGVVEKMPGISSKSLGPYHQRRLVIYPAQHASPSTDE